MDQHQYLWDAHVDRPPRYKIRGSLSGALRRWGLSYPIQLSRDCCPKYLGLMDKPHGGLPSWRDALFLKGAKGLGEDKCFQQSNAPEGTLK
jgi:hypothetical protein